MRAVCTNEGILIFPEGHFAHGWVKCFAPPPPSMPCYCNLSVSLKEGEAPPFSPDPSPLPGFLWFECKEVWIEGLRSYLLDWWNFLDVVILSLYLASFALRLLLAGLAYMHCQEASNSATCHYFTAAGEGVTFLFAVIKYPANSQALVTLAFNSSSQENTRLAWSPE